MKFIIELRNLHYRYPNGPEALKGISLGIKKGKKIALVGPNGAGKTTLMLMFNGMLQPTSGIVLFKESPLAYNKKGLFEVRKRVGLVFQHSDAQVFAPTVYQDVAFGPVNLDFHPDQVKTAVHDSLLAVGMTGSESRPPHSLSGGEMKRVAIAGILAMDPDVLVLDEPTGSLDPTTAEEIVDLLDELNCQGRTIIISTHDVELAYRWADEVVLIQDGAIIYHGTPENVFGNIRLLKNARLKSPFILEICHALQQRCIIDMKRYPRSILQFTDMLDGALSCCQCHPSTGTINVCNVDSTNPAEIRRFISDQDARLGVMGTSAKKLAEKENFRPDFTYGVIDKCILKALVGEHSVILTSGGMVQHICHRIDEYSDESGKGILVILIHE